jgi:hypothetical protein
MNMYVRFSCCSEIELPYYIHFKALKGIRYNPPSNVEGALDKEVTSYNDVFDAFRDWLKILVVVEP